MGTYRKNTGAVFSLQYHLVWCLKYRRPVLVSSIADRLKARLVEKAEADGLAIQALEIMPDHVHLFLERDPMWAPAGIAARLKGYTSHIRWNEFPHLRSRLPTLWSRSYSIGTIGHVSEETVH
jgi:putative transposase